MVAASWNRRPRGLSFATAERLSRHGDGSRLGVYLEEFVLESRGTGVAPITLRGEGSPRPTLVPKDRVRGAILRVQGRWNLDR